MYEVASTILELIGNLLDPMAYVIGVMANLNDCDLLRMADASLRDGRVALQVRIQLVDGGRVPDYRIEIADPRDPNERRIIGVFDGLTHSPPVDSRPKSIDPGRWSDIATPAEDAEKLMVILRRYGGTVGIGPIRTMPN